MLLRQTSTTQSMTAEREATAIRQAVEKCNGMITSVARLLGMSTATF